MKKIAIKKD